MSKESASEGIPEEKKNNPASNPNPEIKTTDAPVTVSQSEPHPAPPIRHDCKKRYKCIKEEIKYWFEIGGIIAGIGVLYLLYMQYREMVKTTKVAIGQLDVMQEQVNESESQQRAFLKFESFQIKRTTNTFGPFPLVTNKYNIEVSIVIKNYGATAAIDLRGNGQTISDRVEAFEKKYGFTNGLIKWKIGDTRQPDPGSGGISIMPQEIFTNTWIEGQYDWGDSFYREFWLSYRDIFGRPWVIGEIGTYNFTNDTFVPEFIDWGKYKANAETNQNTN